MILKLKKYFMSYWMRIQQNWARADEIHRQVEAQRAEILMKYGNKFQGPF